MFKRTIVLSILLSCFVFSNSFSNINKVNKPEYEYYKTHKWDFMDKIFMGKASSLQTSYDKYDKLFLLAPFILSAGVFFVDAELEEKLLLFFFSTALASIISAISYTAFDLHKKKGERFFKVLEHILKNYDLNADSNLEINYRNLLPEEFRKSFDEMFKVYSVKGAGSLYSFFGIVYQLRDRIRYDVKKEKYAKPTTVVVTSYI